MEAKQQELEYYIYITTNMLNGMQYLGQHTHKIGTKDSYLGSGVKLVNAIKKYKKENFHKEILYYAFDENELNEIEVWYIKHLDAVNDPKFYNLHCGGSVQHGKNNAAYGYTDKAVKCIETGIIYKSINEAAKHINVHASNISMVINSTNRTGGYTWEFVDKVVIKKNHSTCKKVFCITNNTTYNSVLEASKILNLDRSSICKVCRGIMKSLKGFTFKYLDESKRECTTSKKIICVTDKKEFNSIEDVLKYYNISKDSVRRSLKGEILGRINLEFKLTT